MDKGVAEAVGVICDYLKTTYTIPIIKITNGVNLILLHGR